MCPTPLITARSRCFGLEARGGLCSRCRRKSGCSSGGKTGAMALLSVAWCRGQEDFCDHKPQNVFFPQGDA